ncbi:phosphohexomutase domain-containing protein [Algicola sagamiensis]|uniref:phosphomannomutase/phosphoglucomutase n=1 Tax=Algicola sagamiensis TaxID=163869 RepID=UPI00036FFC8E|nr:phosphomannomutase/phosphoglucomutase [Algicola sagamiensis]
MGDVKKPIQCFKAYDLRGHYPSQINTDVAYRVSRAFAQWSQGKTIVIGGDCRESTPILKEAASNGIQDAGIDVIDIGLSGSEQVYFAVNHFNADGGIEVTASHNPKEDNGMKFVGHDAVPVYAEHGFPAIQEIAEASRFLPNTQPGKRRFESIEKAYLDHLFLLIDLENARPKRIVVNPGNGAAGPTIEAIESYFQTRDLPYTLFFINQQPDPTFPNGVPNPLLKENHHQTSKAVCTANADLGVAWDGDFDRCFFFDDKGHFFDSYYVSSLLAQLLLKRTPNQPIIHDPRLTWLMKESTETYHGQPVQSESGHAFFKQAMHTYHALYGAEASGHHYFRDFFYCDSGILPWLLMLETLKNEIVPISTLNQDMQKAHPVSGEINLKVSDLPTVLSKVHDHYAVTAKETSWFDGLSLEFDDWRFNLRGSNTEPLLRLNLETRGQIELLHQKKKELLQFINTCEG